MFDLKIDQNGDLAFAGNLDLMGAVGDQVPEQRVIVRLKIPKGTWIYDLEGTLGSQLREIIRNARSYTADRARTYVMDALAPASDISVAEVQIIPSERGSNVDVVVSFRNTLSESEIVFPEATNELLVTTLTL
jgi:phage gp46-like protein